MKPGLILIVLWLFMTGAHGRSIENKDLGIRFDLPTTWDSVAVMEKNKPMSFFEATRSSNHAEFVTATAFTSKGQPVDESRLEAWKNDMTNALSPDNVKVLKSKIVSNTDVNWYSGIFKVHGAIVYIFSTYIHGYEYSFSFANKDTDKKTFEKETESMIRSVVFEVPASFARVKEDIKSAKKDDATGFVMPANFYLTTELDRGQLSPYAYELYKELLRQNNTDVVLVSKVYVDQLFCLNIKKNMPAIGLDVLKLISNMSAKALSQNGGTFEEVFVGVWDKAPGKVQLQKFRTTKNGQAALVYIFYCQTVGGKTNVIKVQVPVTIETIFEPDIYELILKNI